MSTNLGYIAKPSSLEDYLHNVEFQLTEVRVYMRLDRDGISHGRECAAIKARCLIDAARDLHTALEDVATPAKREEVHV